MTGEEISAWRESRGLSRQDLADMCHTKYGTVANWELNRNSPRGAAKERLESLMHGRIAVVDLTPMEEKLLNEAVKRGGFKDRTAFFVFAITELIKREAGIPSDDLPLVAEKAASYGYPSAASKAAMESFGTVGKRRLNIASDKRAVS